MEDEIKKASEVAIKQRPNRKLKLISALIVIILAAVAVYVAFFRVDPHYKLGLQNLKARNYEQAESEFRLCLENHPNDSRTKGLLAYSIVRNKISDEDMKPEKLANKCLVEFLTYYSHIDAEDLTKNIASETSRDWANDRKKDAERRLRDLLKENHIRFRDWIEFRLGVIETARVVYSLHTTDDEDVDCAFKAIAAAVLARDGDRDATKYLMDQCATNSDYLSLTLIAGSKIHNALEDETKRKGSFIESEAGSALRKVKLVDAVDDFVRSHPQVRVMRKGDLPEQDVDVYSDCLDFNNQWYSDQEGPILYAIFGGFENQIVLMEALKKGIVFDPQSIHINEVVYDRDKYIASIGGFDDQKKKYVCRLLLWNGSNWINLVPGNLNQSSDKEVYEKYPAGLSLCADKSGKHIAISVRCCSQVTRSTYKNEYVPVTRYRQEYRYNPYSRWNSYYKEWEGGYELVDVPYKDSEYVTKEVKYKERTVGNKWLIFRVDSKNKHLWFQKEKWMEYEMPFDTKTD